LEAGVVLAGATERAFYCRSFDSGGEAEGMVRSRRLEQVECDAVALSLSLNTMSTSELKLNLLERLVLVQDAGLLQRLKQVFDRELAESDDFTEDELAELHEIDRRRKAGLDTYLSMEDAMRMIREGRPA